MSTGLLVVLGAAALAALSMPVYALRGGGPDPDVRRKGSTFLLGAGNFFLHWFVWVLSPLERLALRLGVGPDSLNFLGLGLGALSGALIATGRFELGGAAVLLAGACDVLDGRVARARRVDSRYGKFIDSTLDRFVEVFALLGFVFALRGFALGPVLAAAALAGSLLVSYARARGETVGVLCKEGLMQRAERMVLLCLACFFDRPVSALLGRPPGSVSLGILGVIAAASLATAAYRTVWIARRLREGEPR
jgi:CDP-diacylglycerol--glycerol-3-phosphate 3-phosphatidyltransferase